MPRDNLLQLAFQIEGETGHLVLEGELIAESRFELERVLREWLESGLRNVIVGLTELRYIDSAGLSTLLGALHRYRRQGGDLILTQMNPALNAIFEVTCMEKYFKIFPTMQEAVEHFAQVDDQRRKSGEAPATPE